MWTTFYRVIIIARKKRRKAKRDVSGNHAPRVIVVPSCHVLHSHSSSLSRLYGPFPLPQNLAASGHTAKSLPPSKRERKATTIARTRTSARTLASQITLHLQFPLESSSSIIGQDTIFRRAGNAACNSKLSAFRRACTAS